MKVIVAAVAENCTASLALKMEGVKHQVGICDGDFGYGELLASIWSLGEGFILIEHDIVPWPGALQAMWDCKSEWCGYPYPYYTRNRVGSRERLIRSHSCGCVKFSDALVRGWPDLPTEREWAKCRWSKLDGLIGRSIVSALKSSLIFEWHEHSPPVAHARIGARY